MLKRTITLVIFLFAFPMLALAANNFFGNDYENTLGARSYGMAGAFSALADEVGSLSYNPAGLGLLNSQEVALTLIPLQEGKIFSGSLSYAFPTEELGGASLSYRRDHVESGSSANQLDLSYAYLLKDLPAPNNLSLGLGLKWLRTDGDRVELNGDGIGFSLGSIYSLTLPQEFGHGIDVGLAVDDLAFYVNRGANVTDVPWIIRLGSGYRLEEVSVISLDLAYNSDSNLSKSPLAVFLGGERWFFGNILGLRGGYNYEALDSFTNYFGLVSAGATLRAEEWKLDYGLGYSTATLRTSYRFSISYRWGGKFSISQLN